MIRKAWELIKYLALPGQWDGRLHRAFGWGYTGQYHWIKEGDPDSPFTYQINESIIISAGDRAEVYIYVK